ncbi:hypothetical protein N825_25470 [Skermanella stibiiresistens SB22]|uniref:Uncharacterized protein n=1 Tax=Skermanella stibiiresistens SB22 TaxID=1385369 RepID=W9GWG3_9PROT|nr:hypothetical protein [Skermanella stibiiresistens]EWY36787.1 hypothetical protein N825_25470 [Skermanella stibiiresistens SB22]
MIRSTAVAFGVPRTEAEVQLLDEIGPVSKVVATYHLTFPEIFAAPADLDAAVAAQLAAIGELPQ